MGCIDLKNYIVGKSFRGMPDQMCLYPLCTRGKKTVAYIYTDLAPALVDIAYSRLCDILHLCCVKSEWGYNLQDDFTKRFVSTSFIGHGWKTYGVWIKNHEGCELSNIDEYNQHMFLNSVLSNIPWIKIEEGFVDSDNKFIKSLNSKMLDGIDLFIYKGEPDNISSQRKSITKSLVSIKQLHVTEMVSRLALITDDEFINCVAMPDCQLRAVYQDYVFSRLVRARSLAIKCMEALSEQKSELELQSNKKMASE